MAVEVIIHLQNEDPVLAELESLDRFRRAAFIKSIPMSITLTMLPPSLLARRVLTRWPICWQRGAGAFL